MCRTPSHISSHCSAPVFLRQASKSGGTVHMTAFMTECLEAGYVGNQADYAGGGHRRPRHARIFAADHEGGGVSEGCARLATAASSSECGRLGTCARATEGRSAVP